MGIALAQALPVWQMLVTGVGFALLFPAVSFLVNRRLCGGTLSIDIPGVALLASLVFLAAILCEASINPLYEHLFHDKLWEYRLFPLHDGNVSALAVAIWTSYGVHLYFLDQSLNNRLSGNGYRNLLKAAIIGIEAPLLWEVTGNGFFLLLLNEYYAYYLPGEIFHLTSLRVIPVYILCIYLGLLVYERLRLYARNIWLSAGIFLAGLMFLGNG